MSSNAEVEDVYNISTAMGQDQSTPSQPQTFTGADKAHLNGIKIRGAANGSTGDHTAIDHSKDAPPRKDIGDFSIAGSKRAATKVCDYMYIQALSTSARCHSYTV